MTKALAEALSRVDAGVLRARARAALAVDVRYDVSAIAIPILYLAARWDRVVARAALADLRQHNPGIQSAELDGPHFLLQCNPAGAWAEISRFLCSGAQVPRRGPDTPLPPDG
jgi:surfactin synthase thioesterase subunit